MKIALLTLAATALALPAPQSISITIDPYLVPPFGIDPGIPSTTQVGSCQGANNINIPCQCPPSPELFLQRLEQFVTAGNAKGISISFPTDDSVQSRLARVNACIDTLQSFDNVLGEGCPIAAAPYFGALQASLLLLL